MVTQDTKRRQIKLTPDELTFWKDFVKETGPHCLLVAPTEQGCAHLLAEYADDVIRELRKRVRK